VLAAQNNSRQTDTMKIKRVLERHSPGAFTVEDENGDQFFLQLAYKIEAIWQKCYGPGQGEENGKGGGK